MEQGKSIYHRAAVWGIPFGVYMAATAAASIFADMFAPLSLVFLVMLVGVPVLVYRYQRRTFVDEDGFTEYAALWMLGIMLFLLGTIVASLLVYLLLQYGRPGFIYEQAQAVIDAYSQVPQMKDNETLKVLQRMVNEGMLPTPIEAVFNAFWFITFGGSMVSALTAWLAQRPLRRSGGRQQ